MSFQQTLNSLKLNLSILVLFQVAIGCRSDSDCKDNMSCVMTACVKKTDQKVNQVFYQVHLEFRLPKGYQQE